MRRLHLSLIGGLLFISGMCVASASIYLTPLRHLAVIPVTTNDVRPSIFWEDWQKYGDSKYIFIDVRNPQEFQNIHVPGSRNVPLAHLFDEWKSLPKTGKKIVLICSRGRAAGVGYGFLENHGFLNLLRIEGGIEEWTKENLPVEGTSVL